METIPFSYAYANVAPGLHCLCLCLCLCLCRSVNQALSSICKNQKNERGDTADKNLGAPTEKNQLYLMGHETSKDHEAEPQNNKAAKSFSI